MIKSMCVLTAVILSPLHTSEVVAQASMMGSVQTVEEDDGTYQQYTVKCGSIEKRKLVRRPLGTELWCDKATGIFCAEERVSTAHLVCGQEHFAALKAMEPIQKTSSPSVTSARSIVAPIVAPSVKAKSVQGKSAEQLALEREQGSIESELIDIEAKKLDLRNRELALLREEASLEPKN